MSPRPVADPALLQAIARRRERGFLRAFVDDLHLGARAGLGGLIVAALVEWLATLWAQPGGLGVVLS
jgi:hypothetical protein